MDPLEREDIVETALQRQFKSLWEWRRPSLGISIGPNDIDAVDSFEEYREQFIQSARRDLLALSDADVAKIRYYDPLVLDETHWLRHLKFEGCRKERKAPPAIAYGFGHPTFQADFIHWCKMPSLDLHEALLLSVGVEPTSITKDQIDKVQQKVSEERQWAAHSFLLKRRTLFARQFRHAGWGFEGTTMRTLKAWFEQISLELHPDFMGELENRLKAPMKRQGTSEKESMTSQERATLLKLVAAMACEQYSFNPTKERSVATSRIQEDLAAVGLSMDAKTIRKWLNEATTLVDEDYWAQE